MPRTRVRRRPVSLPLQSLVARITEDHRASEKNGEALTWRNSECVIVEDANPPQRRGECLCAAKGRVGFVPRSKLLLLGYMQVSGGCAPFRKGLQPLGVILACGKGNLMFLVKLLRAGVEPSAARR